MGSAPAGYVAAVLLHDALQARARLAFGRDVTLGSFLEQSAAVRGDRRLVEEADGTTQTQAEAAEKVDRMAGSIAPQVEPGGRVVVATPNTYDQYLACLAACRAGAIAVPVNTRMRDEEVDHVIADAEADLVVRDVDELAGGDALGESRAGDPAETAMLFYT